MSEIELLQSMRFQYLELGMTMIQIQEFENPAESATPHFASRRVACLKCGFEATDFDGFCYHVKLCEIQVKEVFVE